MEKKLLTANPYNILGVSIAASNAEITKAFTLAMKRRQYPVDVIAKARKSLMNPKERIIADYLRPFLPAIKRLKKAELSALKKPEPKLTFLSDFDNLELDISKVNSISETDKILGLTLFSTSPI